MNARFLLLSAAKDLRRRATDPLALVLWLGIPVMIGALLALVSGAVRVAARDGPAGRRGQGPGGPPDRGALGQGPLGSLFEVGRVTAADGRARLDAGEATALILIPSETTVVS